ncbi:hypothetical protein [Actinoplanes regularis]|uniref:hypothetical protein n=1 Tax=Actinoplanes regularis TaxID=52697 RepID=UPI001943BEE7|nr:hypothetical protein [Actinoplanes regularis]
MTVLDIPPLAVTNASSDPEWGDVPIGQGTYRRSPSQRLPLDPRTAKAIRRYRRLVPWALPVNLTALVVFCIAIYRDDLPLAIQLAGIGMYMTTTLGWHRVVAGLPPQRPRRLRSGDLRIPEVPIEVAEQWIARNPGVTATDEPMPHPHSRRYYARWSIGLVTAAIVLVVVLANDGREDLILFWQLASVLFVAGLVMALRTLPPVHGKPKYTLLG